MWCWTAVAAGSARCSEAPRPAGVDASRPSPWRSYGPSAHVVLLVLGIVVTRVAVAVLRLLLHVDLGERHARDVSAGRTASGRRTHRVLRRLAPAGQKDHRIGLRRQHPGVGDRQHRGGVEHHQVVAAAQFREQTVHGRGAEHVFRRHPARTAAGSRRPYRASELIACSKVASPLSTSSRPTAGLVRAAGSGCGGAGRSRRPSPSALQGGERGRGRPRSSSCLRPAGPR